MPRYTTVGDIVRPEASGVRGAEAGYELQDKQQNLEDDGKARDEYLSLFRSAVRIWLAEEFLKFNTTIPGGAKEILGYIVLLARIISYVALYVDV